MSGKKRTIAAPVNKVEPIVQQPEEGVTENQELTLDQPNESDEPEVVEPVVQQPTVFPDTKTVIKPVAVQKAAAANPILSGLPKPSKKTKVTVRMPNGTEVRMNRTFAEKAVKLNKGAKIID